MLANIYLTNKVIFSGRVVSLLINKGLSREDSYDAVQKIAMEAYDNNLDFQELLKKSAVTKYLSNVEIDSCFELDYYLRNIDTIYNRLKLGE